MNVLILLAWLAAPVDAASPSNTPMTQPSAPAPARGRRAVRASFLEDGRLELVLDRPIGRGDSIYYQLVAVLKDGRRGEQSSVLSCGERIGVTSDKCAINTRLLPRDTPEQEKEVWQAFKKGNVKELTVRLNRSLDGNKTKEDSTEARFLDL